MSEPTILYYVYILIKPWDGEICYVGKGSFNRVSNHKTLGAKHYNVRLAHVYAKAKQLGMKVKQQKLLYGYDEDEIFAAEKELIETLRHNGIDLCNAVPGGRWEFQYKYKKSKVTEDDEEEE
jgi:hypothetical protein